MQLFEWAYTERDGRVGSYEPWDELQGADELSIIVGVENHKFETAVRVLYEGFAG